MSKAVELITKEEGFKGVMYTDHLGNWTIGHGITNMTEEESAAVVAIRAAKIADKWREEYEWFHRLTEVRQAVLVSMVYQLGWAGVGKFKNMLEALEDGDYNRAAEEGLDSRWARQTPQRAERAMHMMLIG